MIEKITLKEKIECPVCRSEARTEIHFLYEDLRIILSCGHRWEIGLQQLIYLLAERDELARIALSLLRKEAQEDKDRGK